MKHSVVRFFICLSLVLAALGVAGLGWWILLTVTIWLPIVIALVGEGQAKELQFTHPLHKLATAASMLSLPAFGIFVKHDGSLLGWYVGMTL